MAYDLGTARGVIEMQYNGAGVSAANKDIAGLGTKSASATQSINKVSNVAGVAGLAIAGGFALAVKAAAGFEQIMSGVAAVSGANETQLKSLSDKALQLGKDTQFSASEAASGIEELVKAGISIPDVLNGAADSVTALAAAGGVDLKTAATISSNAMNAFSIKAKDMGGVVDSIAGAANASAIDVAQFGDGLAQVGAVAHLAGVDFHDTATAIAIMGNAGIKGSDAGTSLKTMFQRLQPTTLKQTTEMERLGLLSLNSAKSMQTLRDNGVKPLSDKQSVLNGQLAKLGANLSGSAVGSAKAATATQKLELQTGALSNAFYTQSGHTKSLAQVSQVLQNSLKGMNDRQKQATLNTLFGSDAIRGAAILSEAGAKGFNKMSDAMGKVSAADVAKKRMDNLKGSIEQMKGSLQTAGIVIGTALIPPLRSLTDFLTKVLNAFLTLSPQTQKWIVVILGAVGAILLIVAAIGKTIIFVNAMTAALDGLKLAFAETWVAALGPWLLVAAAFAAIIILIVILWKHSETFRAIVTGAWNAIKAAISAVWGWISGTLVPGITGAWNSIKSGAQNLWGFITSVWNGIKNVISTVMSVIAAVIGAYIAAWKAVITGGLNAIKAVWSAVWGAFGPLITAVFHLIVAIIKLAWAIIRLVFYVNLLVIKTIVHAVFTAIKTVITTVLHAIVAVVHAVWGVIKSVISAALHAILAVTHAVWGAILAVVHAVWGRIGGTVTGAVNKVKGVVTGAWNAVKSVTQKVWGAVVGAIHTAVGNMLKVVGTIAGRVKDALKGAGTWLLDAGKAIVQGLIDGITSMINKVSGAIGSVTDKIKSFVPNSPSAKEGPLRKWGQPAHNPGASIIRTVIEGINKMAKPLADAMDSATGAGVAPLAYATPGHGTTAAPQRARRGGDRRVSRIVSGELRLDESGRAFIRGVAEDAVSDSHDYSDTLRRMG